MFGVLFTALPFFINILQILDYIICNFEIHSKMDLKIQSSHTIPSPIHIASLINNIPDQNVTFVKIAEAKLSRHYHPKSIVIH